MEENETTVGEERAEGDQTPETDGKSQEKEKDGEKSFDTAEGLEAYVSEQVQKALEAERARQEEEKKESSMSPEEKQEYQQGKKEKELAEREKKLLERELKADAVTEFTEKGIPAKLADCLTYSNRESFEESKSAAVSAFQEAVKQSVNEKLRGKRIPVSGALPPRGAASDPDEFVNIIKSQQARR